ncbi:MAG TPA: exo-alpha-sialidase [Mycobacteriales bacterium]|nr:exo-alpha-sialidase [Mycobacteriales bacterium]
MSVGTSSEHWGPSLLHSDDLGTSWQEAVDAVRFPEGTDAALARIWQLQPAGADQPDVVYAGAEPAALFRSDDRGRTFTLVEALWRHPTRSRWAPGYGGECLHTVLPHPDDPDTIVVAVSTGGAFRSTDGGLTWTPANTGIETPFLPEASPEFGQCVHKIARDPVRPEQMFLQNHGRTDSAGVYRSTDGGLTWTPASDGLPHQFGFPVAAHPHRSGTAYLFPLVADADRVPAERRCRVYRTTDAGRSWDALADGLPAAPHYGVVLRDAMCLDQGTPAGVYFGNRNGEVYASRDDGDSWALVAGHLPDVLCVRAAVLEG